MVSSQYRNGNQKKRNCARQSSERPSNGRQSEQSSRCLTCLVLQKSDRFPLLNLVQVATSDLVPHPSRFLLGSTRKMKRRHVRRKYVRGERPMTDATSSIFSYASRKSRIARP
ncbi:hypothetical protein GWI33_014289 [Rhynchophorus ferrugineus]|uniref:Uncharacterized protein n=1 Tax=Rhynchophorus ferrugineus TaxID=354439 RepID=A0A834M5P5_RHYFE|nr:hypothetical protein GWI33_014289 [Rhynchophorus ferrugineus]